MTDNQNYSIRKLQTTDTINNFKTGNPLFTPLKTFLKNHAKEFQQSHVAQTYVAASDNHAVLGFITLTCSGIDLRSGYMLDDANMQITTIHYQQSR